MTGYQNKAMPVIIQRSFYFVCKRLNVKVFLYIIIFSLKIPGLNEGLLRQRIKRYFLYR